MSVSLKGYVLLETLISVFMNALLSACATWLASGGRESIALWGAAGLAIDFLPQSFMVGLMSALMPTVLTRKRRRAGNNISRWPGEPASLPQHAFLRATLFALATVVIAGGAVVLLLKLSGVDAYSLSSVFEIKTVYGAVVAAIVTPFALRAVLREV
jgi:hypothetical protein